MFICIEIVGHYKRIRSTLLALWQHWPIKTWVLFSVRVKEQTLVLFSKNNSGACRMGRFTQHPQSYKSVYNSDLKEPGHPEVTGASDALKHKAVTKNPVYDPWTLCSVLNEICVSFTHSSHYSKMRTIKEQGQSITHLDLWATCQLQSFESYDEKNGE